MRPESRLALTEECTLGLLMSRSRLAGDEVMWLKGVDGGDDNVSCSINNFKDIKMARTTNVYKSQSSKSAIGLRLSII